MINIFKKLLINNIMKLVKIKKEFIINLIMSLIIKINFYWK